MGSSTAPGPRAGFVDPSSLALSIYGAPPLAPDVLQDRGGPVDPGDASLAFVRFV